MADTKKLRAEWEKAEADAVALQNKKDAAIDKVRAEYGEKLREAVNDAAAKQKLYLDAEAAAALLGRDDAETVAANLGLTLPDQD
jgi:predicted DNA-binding protein (UPF0278 family)